MHLRRALLRKGHKLGEYRATAICGNDALSSILYMAGESSASAGVFAPVAVCVVIFVLYIFRAVYAEAVTSLPLNGGAYNVLLNTTRKSTAAIAAVLTLLSYIATAVVSSTEAIHYLKHVFDFSADYIIYGVIALLFFFAVLNFIGIGESANVALVIFVMHITTLAALLGFSLVHLARHGAGQLADNWDNQSLIQPSYVKAIAFGFSSAMLGVTGTTTHGAALPVPAALTHSPLPPQASSRRPTTSRNRSPASSSRPSATCGGSVPSSTRSLSRPWCPSWTSRPPSPRASRPPSWPRSPTRWAATSSSTGSAWTPSSSSRARCSPRTWA
jgi:hypothetical protein